MGKSTARILQEATEVIRSGRWIKGRFTDKQGNFCMWGAVEYACGMRDETGHTTGRYKEENYLPAVDLLENLIIVETKEDSIPGFNDAPDTTLEQATAIMQLAATRAVQMEGVA